MVQKRLFHAFILAIFVVANFVPTAFAHEFAKTYIPQDFNSWKTFGSVSVTSSKVTLDGAKRGWAYIDIDAKDIDSKYILLATYADKSDSRTSYSSSDKARSGNPYLYAYYLDGNGKIQKYLSGTETKTTTRSDSDYVVYGIFPVISGTKTIRVFLKQATVKNISNYGVSVSFMKPVLIKASSSNNAQALLNAFAQQNLYINNL